MEKSFGIILFIILILFGTYPFKLNVEDINFYLITIAFSILFITIFNEKILYIPTRLWILFGVKLSRFLSPIFIFLIYLIGFIIPGLFMKLFKIDIIDKNITLKKKSYWNYKEPEDVNMKDQF
jgi:hypothetical protein